MEENWKWVKGFEGIYQISDRGRLKSFHSSPDGYILSNKDQTGNYLSVILRDGKGKFRSTRLHVLVAESFIGEIPKGYQVHHKNRNKQDNRVENLEILHPCKHSLETVRLNPACVKAMNDKNRYEKPRHIKQITMDGHFIAEYVNAQVASQFTGVCARNILSVARKEPYGKNGNIRKQAGGYIWEFAE